jgi:ribose transport system ATP-binding protein
LARNRQIAPAGPAPAAATWTEAATAMLHHGETNAPSVLSLTDISKAFGPTLASDSVSFVVSHGEVLGLVGANGAGKSTLMRILAGVTTPDSGTLSIAGNPIDFTVYSPQMARRQGIRFVHQELSLCDNLSVVENFYLEAPNLSPGRLAWRGHYKQLAQNSIGSIFPDSGIDVSARLGALPIAQRQMVEIARAASDPHLRLLILDEPTSTLDARRSEDLRRYITRQAIRGISFIFISHRLREVTLTVSRVVVMKGGKLVKDAARDDIGLEQIVELMIGGATRSDLVRAAPAASRADSETLVELPVGSQFAPDGLRLSRGEIVGIAGLEGNGQRAFLHALYAARGRGRGKNVRVSADVGYVSGDRAGEGTFVLWTVLMNATLSRIAREKLFRWVHAGSDRKLANTWIQRAQVDASRVESPIVELSGGNQQKVLMARALIGDADVIALDDPTRGVDIAVKREFYRLIAEAAKSGKLIVWHSSEDVEFLECNRVLLFHEDEVVEVLVGEAISEDAIISKSFGRRVQAPESTGLARPIGTRARLDPFRLIPFLTMAGVFILIALLNHNAASLFGIDLLMGAAVPLVIIALGQMFVLGGSEIDLGIGAFAGLINVLSATSLVEAPSLGALWLAACLAAYCVLGLVIHLRQIPSLVVTLGASFIWGGIGYALQPTPGGASPAWLAYAASFTVAGAPASVSIVALATAAAALLNNSRTGVVLRGFGNNPRALAQGGWSPGRFYLVRYLISGTCALLAGLSLTAVNAASDINAGGPYTLLSVAAAVIGGCALSGGNIAPIGVMCGAVTLSLIGALLGFVNVSTDFNAAVQGSLLIAILMIRTVSQRKAA